SDTNSSVNIQWGTAGVGLLTLYQLNPEGCDSVVNKAVVLPPSPNPIIGGDTPVCAFSVEQYAVTNIPGHTYQWSVIGGTILGTNTGSGVTIAWGQAGVGRLTVTQRSNVGCDSSRVLDIRINPRPKAVISGNSFACSNLVSTPYYQEDYKAPPKPNIRYDWTVVGGTIVGNNLTDSVIIRWGVSGTHPIFLRATDTITGCFMEDTFYVTVGIIEEPTIVADNQNGCIPMDINLNNATPVDSLEYEWTILGTNLPGDVVPNPQFQITTPGTYTARVIVRNKYGCADTAEMIITAEVTPIADFEVFNEDNLMLGDSAYFINLSQGATDYEWYFHDGDISFDFEPEKYYPNPGTYNVTLIAKTGISSCPDTVTKNVTIRVEPIITVPTAFTPNGDNRNDYWNVDMYYILEVEVIVFNRWGEILFQSTDLNFQWDGTYKGVPVQEDVYAYHIRARGFNNELVTRKGNISVIR
ncbi:MAG: T9SS type B sorting domain-containing protein, partial [Bacteroidota bacterium]|nr:T9SS type B sorting domain-containing protein [Bacteroidota bacterium]MDX5431344.1 T9SS type B sorting domain-containing protein [Bacteroidota bacterium]MDX5470072.1 T9SS type B sorting domain-containing protein [Bacteroidota bacterium]